MRAGLVLALVGVLLAAALGFAAHVVAQDTIALPAVSLESNRPLAPQEARKTRTETTETAETETRPRTEPETTPTETEPADDHGGGRGSNSGPGGGGGDNSGPGGGDD